MDVVKKLLLGDYPSFLSSLDDVEDENENHVKQNKYVVRTVQAIQVPVDKSKDRDVCIPLTTNHQDSLNHSRKTIAVPSDCGMMIELFNDDSLPDNNFECNQQKQQTRVLLHTAVPDKVYEHIHPNCHAPAYLRDIRLLHGGGSGTAVFHGIDDCNTNEEVSSGRKRHHLGSIVMKHGGSKDAGEVFSLVTIRQELISRVEFQQQILKREAYAAAERMRHKIPEFVMVYLSSYHLRDRQQELWNSIRYFSQASGVRSPLQSNRMSMRRQSMSRRMTSFEKKSSRDSERKLQRAIQLSIGKVDDNDNIEQWELSPRVITVHIDSNIVPDKEISDNGKDEDNVYVIEDGLDGLQRFAKTLRKEMADHQWKVTLAQKTIGGPNAENGSYVLSSGKLNRMIEENKNVENQTSNSVLSGETTTTTTNNPLLRRLVVDFCQIMEDLSILTYPNERCGSRVESMLQEIRNVEESIENNASVSYHDLDYGDPTMCISKELDLFVGAAIHKNYDPIDGRFIKLREFAVDILSSDFETLHDSHDNQLGLKSPACPALSRNPLQTIISEGLLTTENDEEKDENCTGPNHFQEAMVLLQTYILTENEEIPARLLATLLYRYEYDFINSHSHHHVDTTGKNSRTGMMHVFVNPPSDRSALDEMEDRGWLELLQHATSFAYDENISASSRSAAMDCIWTCGLTDAGLHNTFIQLDRGVELFDLGEPRLEPQPAFLTKFLMSYFHTLGMEGEIGSNGRWVQRFNVIRTESGTILLDLTDETKNMLPKIHDTFMYTLDYFIENIFYGNQNVRVLLLKYVVLQLLSDSSFCIARWQEKGGGTDRYGGKEKEPLEKWIWRSLWDQYIATYVYTQLLLPCEQIHSWRNRAKS
jgi:hypothetical protein